MTPHINAKIGDFAETVLMPGDPVRAKYIADNFLSDIKIVNSVRGNFGFTGYYKDKRVSIQPSGMGQPSIGIYSFELFDQYGVNNIIRVGTCGAIQENMNIGDCVIAISSATDSNIVPQIGGRFVLSPCCSILLLQKMVEQIKISNIPLHVGQIVSNDKFYQDNTNWWKEIATCGVLAVDMETSYLYYLANKFKKHALSVNMVSDSLVSGDYMTSSEKETKIHNIAEQVLDLVSIL